MAEALSAMESFGQSQATRDYDLSPLIQRVEASCSSQIEGIDAYIIDAVLAEHLSAGPRKAILTAGNVAAIRVATDHPDNPVDTSLICAIHDTLMANSGRELGLRDVQVWIGGTPFSPHEAAFVPPHASRMTSCLDDLARFGARKDMHPIAKAAVSHAQFETIHPFTDGNGRTGRALIQRILASDTALRHATLPISSALLFDIRRYIEGLNAYRDGHTESIIACLVDAIQDAVMLGAHIQGQVDKVLGTWREMNTDRSNAVSHRLPSMLVEQPVVSASYVAQHLGVSAQTARRTIKAACERGILTELRAIRREPFYQAGDLIDILEDASYMRGNARPR